MTICDYIEEQVDYHKRSGNTQYSKGWNDAMDHIKRLLSAKFKNKMNSNECFILATKASDYCMISPEDKPFITPDGIDFIANQIFDTQVYRENKLDKFNYYGWEQKTKVRKDL